MSHGHLRHAPAGHTHAPCDEGRVFTPRGPLTVGGIYLPNGNPIGTEKFTYKLDPSSITAQNLMLVKNPGGLGSDTVKFDQVRLWNGETTDVTPLVANGDL